MPSRHASKPEPTPWQNRLNKDVVYIISDQEKAVSEKLTTDDAGTSSSSSGCAAIPRPGQQRTNSRKSTIAASPTQITHFTHAPSPGWRTNLGRMHIKYGPPDEIDSHPSGGPFQRPDSEGGATVSMPPFKDWLYLPIKGVGTNAMMEFVDTKRSGDFRMTFDLNPKGKKVN